MIRLAIYCVGIVVSVFLLTWVESPTAVGVWSGFTTGLLIPVIDLVLSNTRFFRLALWQIRRYRSEIRLSVSYLFRIKIDDKYLLVRGSRFPNNFQPVGGVYKFNPSARDRFSKWGIRSDDLIPIDSVSSDDLRIRVPGKNLITFMKWFEAGRNREVGAWREFSEELVESGILPRDEFSTIRCDWLRTHLGPMRYSSQARSHEILMANIFELVPTSEQEKILRDPTTFAGVAEVSWFTEEQIRRRGAEPGKTFNYVIPETAEWAL